jgi:hypothetical protein
MARNEEKAQSLLNRWTTMKQEFAKGGNGNEYVLQSNAEYNSFTLSRSIPLVVAAADPS